MLSKLTAHPQTMCFDWSSRCFAHLYTAEEYSCLTILPLHYFIRAKYSIWLILLFLIFGLELLIEIAVSNRKNAKMNRAYNDALEKALAAAESANTAKSEFFSHMSHDMRTPLNAVLGFTTLAKDSPEVSPKIAEYLCQIDDSGRYLLGIINDVLDMSKIEGGKLELHPEFCSYSKFSETIRTIIEPKAQKENVNFIMSHEGGGPESIWIDKLRLQQIVVNLLNNAVKFTPSGGQVEFLVSSGKARPDGRIPLTLLMRDNGCGMSEEFVKTKLFQAFEQDMPTVGQNEQGTGLGLSIARKLVEQMGGTIECESVLEKGTTFIVRLCPETGTGSSIAENEKSLSDYSALYAKHILICEDNRVNVIIAQKLLEKVGCIVEVAENGRLGVERFTRSSNGFYAAILMDIRMPEMDGLEATKAIRALDRMDAKTIPIIAMSANAFAEDMKKSLSAGMNMHLSKPIEPQKLYAALAEQIGKEGNRK